MFSENIEEYTLYRIINGKFYFTIDKKRFYLLEPSNSLILESYEIYKEVYESAFLRNVYCKTELDGLLIEQDIWNPILEKQLEAIVKEIEDAKVQAYQSFYKPKELRSIKLNIYNLERRQRELLHKKHAMDQLSCHGVAENARWEWLLDNSVFKANGEKALLPTSDIMHIYRENSIDNSTIRKIARSGHWRAMWSASKKSGSLFPRPTTEFTRDQLSLCSYSSMYDSVYEHPEAPDDKVVEDDECLDGWFIFMGRKQDEEKKKRNAEKSLGNSKIKNAKEVFIMAETAEDAQGIFSLNDPLARRAIKQRSGVIKEKGTAKDIDFADVKQELEIRQNQMVIDHLKGRR